MKRQQGYVQVISFQNNGALPIRQPRIVWKTVTRWWQLHHQRQQLAGLSDLMLKDIGLSRADVETESRKPFWDDPDCWH